MRRKFAELKLGTVPYIDTPYPCRSAAESDTGSDLAFASVLGSSPPQNIIARVALHYGSPPEGADEIGEADRYEFQRAINRSVTRLLAASTSSGKGEVRTRRMFRGQCQTASTDGREQEKGC